MNQTICPKPNGVSDSDNPSDGVIAEKWARYQFLALYAIAKS